MDIDPGRRFDVGHGHLPGPDARRYMVTGSSISVLTTMPLTLSTSSVTSSVMPGTVLNSC